MNYRYVHIALVVLLFAAKAGVGQGIVEKSPFAGAWMIPDAPEPARWEVTVKGGYTWADRAVAYSSARFNVAYRTPRYYGEVVLNLNQRQNFTFLPGRFILEVNDDLVGFTDSTLFEAPPETYDLDEPVGLHFGYQRQRWQLAGVVSMLVQRSRLQAPEIQQTQGGLYFINWVATTAHRTSLVGSVVGTYWLGPLALRGGVLAAPLLDVRDAASPYAYRARARPYGGLAVDLGAGRFDVGADPLRVAATYRHTLRPRLFGMHPLRASLGYQRGMETYRFDALHAQVTLPLSPSVEAMLGYEQTWANEAIRDQAGFERWQAASVFGQLAPLNRGLPHQQIAFGVRVRLTRKAAPWPLRLVQARLLQEHIYSAKQGFYATNPVGLVEVLNEYDAPVAAQVFVETTDGGGTYRSARFTLDAGERREVPFYLYLSPDAEDDVPASSEQLIVSALVGEQNHVLTSMPITMYGKNAWDGNVWALQYFIAPDDPVIKRRSNQLYLGTLFFGTAAPSPTQKMAHLRAFLTALGNGLHYIPDATTTQQVDQVQYPIETLSQGGGDCEDLAVLFASNLMAVGIQTAVVDIRPRPQETAGASVVRPGEPGHVFLLIDTGLPPSAQAELGLTEFQSVIRQNARGAHTIWIPIEPTVLAEGFEAAFKDGAQLYYREVILRNGVISGDVQVYDF